MLSNKATRQTTMPQATDHRINLAGGIESTPVGLPDYIKRGVKILTGLSLDDVAVYYNSVKPARFQASAYTQGTEIHIGPGQEKHLPMKPGTWFSKNRDGCNQPTVSEIH